ncbi:hypothetical protein TKK_0013287 [Trichogramma kaykai]
MRTQVSSAQVVLAMATGCEKAVPAVADATTVTESNFHRIISVIYHFYRWHFELMGEPLTVRSFWTLTFGEKQDGVASK